MLDYFFYFNVNFIEFENIVYNYYFAEFNQFCYPNLVKQILNKYFIFY